MATRLSLAPPNLPVAPNQYERRYQEQLNNVQRLFYNGIANAVNLPYPYGSFYTTGPNIGNAGVTAVNLVSFGRVASAYNTKLNGTRIYVAETAVYNVQFSAQCALNSGAANKIAYFWLKQNGKDVADSAGKITVSSATPMMAAWNYLLALQSGDYIELAWSSSDSDMILQQEPAQTVAPARPALPAVILTIVWASPYNTSVGIS